MDAGDPVNFISLATAAHPVHLIQVVGSATPPADCGVSPTPDGCPDQVIPNSATARLISASAYLPAPLTAVPLTQLPSPAAPGPQVNPAGFRAFVNFTVGGHGSIIDPTTDGAATVEMQTEAISFASPSPAGAPGNLIFVGNPAVIQP